MTLDKVAAWDAVGIGHDQIVGRALRDCLVEDLRAAKAIVFVPDVFDLEGGELFAF